MANVDPEVMLRDLAERASRIAFGDKTERQAVIYRAEMLIRKVAARDPHYVGLLHQVEFSPGVFPAEVSVKQEHWKRGCNDLANLLHTIADQIHTFGAEPADAAPDHAIEQICEKFHQVARQLRSRHASRPTIDITDEYDVQDLMHALLKLKFEDVRPEECTPSYAGKACRMDFLCKRERVVVEVKKTRPSLGAAEVGTQLIEDIARYRSHPDCGLLVCFVYDPEGLIGNPRGLEHDLMRAEQFPAVRVYIRPL